MHRRSLLLALAAVLPACASGFTANHEEARAITRDAYVFAYPMLFNYQTLYEQTQVPERGETIGGFNRFRHAPLVRGDRGPGGVAPVTDPAASWAWLDLRAEPVVLGIPTVDGGRDYSFQLVDLFARNVGHVVSVGREGEAVAQVVAGPGWTAPDPVGVDDVIRSSTDFVMVLGRFGVRGPDDAGATDAFRERLTLQPLSAARGEPAPEPAPAVSWLPWDQDRALSVGFLEYLNALLGLTDPGPTEAEVLARFEPIGVGPGRTVDVSSLSSAQQLALIDGVADAGLAIQERVATMQANLERVGTREFLGSDALGRAAAADIGLYGNATEETWHVTYAYGEDGERLTGADAYELRFAPGGLPPVDQLWSLTVSLPDGFLDGDAGRSSTIGDRTPGLVTGADGSLTISIQHAVPEERQGNWLPAPEGPFVVVLRLYAPKPQVLDGTWKAPPMQRVPEPVSAD